MRIAIDVREACKPQKAGKGQWAYEFVEELLTRDVGVLLLTDSALPEKWTQSKVLRLKPGVLWHWRAASYIESSRDIDVYISPTSFIVPFLLPKRIACVPVIHDMIAFRSEPHDIKATLIERLLLKRALKKAVHILTVSGATKNDVLERFSFLSSANVSPIFAGPTHGHARENTPDGKTILCIATLSPRKNQLRLIKAYKALPEALRKQFQLLLVGSRGWNDNAIVQLAQDTDGVTWKGYVEERQYQSLLCNASVFAFPSLYEGFGLPVLDAMQRGLPVLTSDCGSLREVAGNAALTIDPDSTDSISKGLERLLTDENLRRDLRAKGMIQAKKFSWKKTVDLFLETIKELQ